MPPPGRFEHADEIVLRLSAMTAAGIDPLMAVKFAGFISVAAVTVYEIAIKDIFIGFASQKHTILEAVTRAKFDRINGKVGYQEIKKDYIAPFGEKYSKRFAKQIAASSKAYLVANGRDFINAYGNIVTWRNGFVHGGTFPTTTTFTEVVQAYEDGKNVIQCLDSSMTR